MRPWGFWDDFRFWLGGRLFKVALRTLPDCASKDRMSELMNGMFWTNRSNKERGKS